LGAIAGWLLVLVEIASGPVEAIRPWLLAVSFNLIAPPLGLMHARLRAGPRAGR